ncbi:VWA domain-containing protein [Leucobacter viscericola]|uniref:VWA domain-containing protein n=1 Tax=Leucobacter viscericola TaxID=2714935 RepID=A0A6G7XJL9_9MICO|nr:VWA domain-containing protein [Leucobacter viscericola]
MLWVALGLLVLAIAGGVLWGLRGRGPKEEVPQSPALLSRSERVRSLPGYQHAVRRRRIMLSALAGIGALALAFGGVVAARPMSTHLIQPENANRDIVLCLDVSGSMSEVVTEVIDVFEKLLPDLKGERIGLTIFNSSPVQVFPLTDDYDFIERELGRMKKSFDYTDEYPEHWAGTLTGAGASLIGDGLTSCVMGFDHEGEERSRTVILATDNELQGAPTVTLVQAAAFAKKQGVRVYAINPADGVSKKESEELSKAMVETGGRSYALRESMTVPDIIAKVQQQEATLLKGSQQLVETDSPDLWIGIFAVLGLTWILVAWRIRL